MLLTHKKCLLEKPETLQPQKCTARPNQRQHIVPLLLRASAMYVPL